MCCLLYTTSLMYLRAWPCFSIIFLFLCVFPLSSFASSNLTHPLLTIISNSTNFFSSKLLLLYFYFFLLCTQDGSGTLPLWWCELYIKAQSIFLCCAMLLFQVWVERKKPFRPTASSFVPHSEHFAMCKDDGEMSLLNEHLYLQKYSYIQSRTYKALNSSAVRMCVQMLCRNEKGWVRRLRKVCGWRSEASLYIKIYFFGV